MEDSKHSQKEKELENLESLFDKVLDNLGGERDRQGLENTPLRVAKSMKFLTQGYDEDPCAIIRSAMFDEEYSQMVLVKDIEVYSLCEHHMLPFFGKAHVAYIPNGRIVGLSKIPRIVDVFARRLQVQERLTVQVANALMTHLAPQAVGVVIRCRHLCMESRGIQTQGEETVTSSMLGALRTSQALRAEFLALARGV